MSKLWKIGLFVFVWVLHVLESRSRPMFLHPAAGRGHRGPPLHRGTPHHPPDQAGSGVDQAPESTDELTSPDVVERQPDSRHLPPARSPAGAAFGSSISTGCKDAVVSSFLAQITGYAAQASLQDESGDWYS